MHFLHGTLTGSPAPTRHRFGTGQGWYLSTRPEEADYGALVGHLLKESDVEPDEPGLPAGVEPDEPGLPARVEAVTRHTADGRRRHVPISHTADTAPLPEPAHDLLTGATAHDLPPGGCAVLRGH